MAEKLQAFPDLYSEEFDFLLSELQDAARSGDLSILHNEEFLRRFSSSLFDFLLEELQDAARSGEPFIFHNEEVARKFSSALFDLYPDHLFISCNDFQAICINRESVDTLIERLQRDYSSYLAKLNEIETQLDFLFRRAASWSDDSDLG